MTLADRYSTCRSTRWRGRLVWPPARFTSRPCSRDDALGRVGTRFAGLGRSTSEINQPFISVLAIALLRPESPRYDDDHAGGGHPPSGEHAQLGALCLIVAW